jgi:F5/8 type C domain
MGNIMMWYSCFDNRRVWAATHLQLLVLTACIVVSCWESAMALNVFTRNYNNRRTGANLSETILNTSNVNSSQFGKLFQLQVDDEVYAGLLYATELPIGNSIHNVLYVATVNNTVYAFDADAAAAPLWQRNFNGTGRPTRRDEVGQRCGSYRDFSGNIGIVGTPVIDGATKTMYFVTRTVEGSTTLQRLRAIDIKTGADRLSPVLIEAPAFSAVLNNQRPALALANNTVYIGWSSFCDTGSYHGFLMAYDAATLQQVGVFNTTPNGVHSGIWMSGAAPAIDSDGNLYITTGNGDWNGTSNFGQSLLKLAPRTLNRLDWFTPSNWGSMNCCDLDLGSAGPIFVPGTKLLAFGGKEGGKGYLINSANLGQLVNGNPQIPQVFQAVDTTIVADESHHLHNSMVAWNSSQGVNLYVWGENDFLRLFRFNAAQREFGEPALAEGPILPPAGMPGGLMAISANGSQEGSGILWATVPREGNANEAVVPGVLYAFNAQNTADTLPLLWSSDAPGDDTYNFSKGAPPLVANGQVYVASLSKIVSVYGLRTTPPPTQNLALHKPATGSTPCSAQAVPAQAFNGSYFGGNADKWCSSAATKFLQVDLGSNHTVNQFVVEHAGAGGQSDDFNTRAFNIKVSMDGTNFTPVVSVTDNIQGITTHNIAPITARFVRLIVTTPTQTADTTARIYEFQVFGPAGSGSITAETEALAVAATSGDHHRVSLNTAYSGGQGTVLEADAVGDFVTHTVNVPEARTYNLRVRIRRANNRGVWQLSRHGVNVGPPVDGFATTSTFSEVDLGNVTFATAGNKAFKFTITGKNASSTGFSMALDYIRFIPR